MIIRKEYSLKPHNTFNIDASSKHFIEIKQISDLIEYCHSEYYKIEPRLILGGGSNILFTEDYKGLILHSTITEIDILRENDEEIEIKVGSGIEWDDLVGYCVAKGWGGLENLSDIPGKVGAAPVQNIGAYGVEAKDTIIRVDAFDMKSKAIVSFNNSDCKFGYRYSVFKEPGHEGLFITHVSFRLSKKHVLNTSYGRVEEEIAKKSERTISSLREVIKDIRGSKLPSTKELGSAGSFFKNPVIESTQFSELQNIFPDIPSYKLDNNRVKIPAAWLIEHTGMKGYKSGDAGTFKNQPLVIVNYGNATGKQIAELAALIKSKVEAKFSIQLEPEVCFV